MNLKQLLFTIIAVIAGYITMVLLITLIQEVIFGGVSYTHTDPVTLGLAGLGTFLSAVAGGALAGSLRKSVRFIPQIIMSLLVVLETTYLIKNHKTIDPLWFDILAAGSLIVGILAGGFLVLRFSGKFRKKIA